MLSRVTVFCFAASYAVALALEASRLWFRSGVRGAVMLGFAAAGLLAHSIFLACRAVSDPVPLSSEFDWYLLAAWLLAAIYLYLTLHFPRTPVGLFTLPLVLGLIGVAQRFADREVFAQTRASQVWGMVHGGFLLLGTVAVLIGFVAGLMHLVQSYRLKHKLPATQGFQLPSLEWLEHANSRATVFSALMLALGFVSGLLLNAVNRERSDGESLSWTDPVILSSGMLLVWMTAAALFSLFYKPARQGRKVAYLTVASFVFLVMALGVQLASSSGHTAREPRRVNGGPSLRQVCRERPLWRSAKGDSASRRPSAERHGVRSLQTSFGSLSAVPHSAFRTPHSALRVTGGRS